MLLEHKCDVQRIQSTNGRGSLQTIYTNVQCLLLPMSAQSAVQNNFDFGRAYDAYFAAGQDVRTGDKLVSGGRTYLVSGVQVFDVPVVGHVRAACEQETT